VLELAAPENAVPQRHLLAGAGLLSAGQSAYERLSV
jgi:hypothetical protein